LAKTRHELEKEMPMIGGDLQNLDKNEAVTFQVAVFVIKAKRHFL